MKREPLVWLSDLGKASTRPMQHGNGLLNEASLASAGSLGEIKMGLIACAKPRMEVIVSTLRQKRLGSSQPIMAARLVLIRSLFNPKPAPSSIL
jgi:hypothetical protein